MSSVLHQLKPLCPVERKLGIGTYERHVVGDCLRYDKMIYGIAMVFPLIDTKCSKLAEYMCVRKVNGNGIVLEDILYQIGLCAELILEDTFGSIDRH